MEDDTLHQADDIPHLEDDNYHLKDDSCHPKDDNHQLKDDTLHLVGEDLVQEHVGLVQVVKDSVLEKESLGFESGHLALMIPA